MRVLLVDDDPEILLVAATVLSGSGEFQVSQAGSAEEALELARLNPPEVVITDYQLPGMNGSQLLERLRADPDLAHIPAIFLTGKTDPSEVEELLELGAQGVIGKPFNPLELVGRIKQILAE